jgi:hypothetical protein
MRFLLFGSGLDTCALTFDRLDGDYAANVRWYNVGNRSTVYGRKHLLALFEACRRHGFFVILSSWEYQQSSAFAVESWWWDALAAVSPDDRPTRLAEALSEMLDFLVVSRPHPHAEGNMRSEGPERSMNRRMLMSGSIEGRVSPRPSSMKRFI